MSETNKLIFIEGIDSNLWINNGKRLSRNFKQGYRVYSSPGIASAITSSSLGGLAGYGGLYLIIKKHE